MERFLLDTHVWIWLIQADRDKLKRSALDEGQELHDEHRLSVSAISVWEVANLAVAGRVTLSAPLDRWLDITLSDPAVDLLPLSPNILVEATRLPGTIHRDPADRMLAATARHHNLTLLTRDDDILSYAKQGHLKARKF
jgi:PIN domain nuclease of toxin-antitoxin system